MYKKIILEELDKRLLQEASLGRLYQHIKAKDPIAFVSGDRDENTASENKKNRTAIKRYIGLANFGYNKVKGGYVEEGGKRVDSESSFVIYGTKEREDELCNLARSLGKKFDQSSILFVDSDGQAMFISTRDDSWVGATGTMMKLGKFTTKNINDFYTRIGNKEFKFETLEEEAKYNPSLSERMLCGSFIETLVKHGDDTIQLWEERQQKHCEEVEQRKLEEASLGRLYQHIKAKDPIAFISGDREENTPSENKDNKQSIKKHLKLSKFGYNKVKGGYVEEGGKKVDAESSFVVYANADREDELKSFAINMGKKFDQSSILFVDSDGQAMFISTRDDSWVGPKGSVMKLGKFTTQNINDFYTRIGNKEFKFETIEEETIVEMTEEECRLSEKYCAYIERFGDEYLDQFEASDENEDFDLESFLVPLEEASLGRFLQHRDNKDPMLFLSGDRAENTKSNNRANQSKIKKLIKDKGFGYNRVKGGYIENGTTAVDAESSFVIYGDTEREQELLDFGMEVGKKFKQDAILFVDSEGKAKFIQTTATDEAPIGKETLLGKVTMLNIRDFYTKIGKKKFKFDSIE